MPKKIDTAGLKHFKDKENAMVASEFSASKSYAIGEYVYYKGTLYKFKAAHAAGAWTNADVDAVKLADDVSVLKESFNRNGLANSNLIGSEGGVLYPVEIPTGTTVTMATADGTVIGTTVTLRFHDINGNDISNGGWSFNHLYSKRTIITGNGGETAYFVSWSSTPAKTVQLNFGSDVLPYEEYNYPIVFMIDQLKANTYEKHNLIGLDSTLYYPVDIVKNTVITMSTYDNEVLGQSNLNLEFYDENKNYIAFWNFYPSGDFRTFIYNKDINAKYIKWNTTPNRAIQVEIGGRTDYTPYTAQIENPNIIKKIYEEYQENDYLLASDIFNAEPYSGSYDWQTPVVLYGALFKGKTNVESFAFFTDSHVLGFDDNSRNETDMANYFKRVQKTYNATPCSFMVCGGDMLNNSTTMDEACYRLGYLKGINDHLLDGCKLVLGNHDTNYQGKQDSGSENGTGRLTDATVAAILYRDTDTKKAYYSFDGDNSKCYVLDSGIEHSTMLDYDWDQISWLAGKLAEDDPAHAIIFLHIIVNSENIQTNATNFGTLVEAYNSHTTVTLNSVEYDFTTCSGHVDFWVAGHTHADSNGMLGGIPYFITASNSYNSDVPLIDLVLVDYDNNLLYLKRVGGTGSDRTISLTTGQLVT